VVVALAAAGTWFALVRGLPVKLIRALDRRGGLASRHGARGYSRLASRFLGGFHARIAGDAAASLAGVAGVTVLDIGSGPGEMALLLARALPEARIVGLDPSAEMIEIARGAAERSGMAERVTFVEAGAERIPLPDGSVDLALSTLSSHHWSDAGDAFAELGRVLRPGGEARIYDVRFAALLPSELPALAVRAGDRVDSLTREVFDYGPRFLRPIALVRLRTTLES
jgi:ubiquinone/menaquinone biosynthesis C-methylase UbiE